MTVPAAVAARLDFWITKATNGFDRLIGVVENLFQGYVGQGLREISGFVVIVLVLMVRPYGLFGKREIERV